MGDERYQIIAWQATILGKRHKEDPNRLGTKGSRRFGRKEELNRTEEEL
jgi:hypothetical protein